MEANLLGFSHPEEGSGLTELVVEDGADEAGRDNHRTRLGERVLKTGWIRRARFQVNHRVRDGVTRGVDLLDNVALLGAQEGRDFAERSGFVLVDDTEARAGGVLVRRQDRRREVDRVTDGTSFKEVHHRVSRHGSRVFFGFFGGRAQVRKHDVTRVTHQVRIGEIGHVLTGERTGLVTSLHGGTVDDFTASKVEQVNTWLTLSQRVGVNQVMGHALDVRDVNGDKVRLLEEFIKLDRTGHLVTGQTPSGFKRKDWIVTDDVHAKAERGVDDAVEGKK